MPVPSPGNGHGPRFGSGALGVVGHEPGRIVPSRPISHSPPKTDSDTTYSPLGSTSTSSAKPSGSPAKSTVRVSVALNVPRLRAVAVVVDDGRALRREAAASSTTRCPVARDAQRERQLEAAGRRGQHATS